MRFISELARTSRGAIGVTGLLCVLAAGGCAAGLSQAGDVSPAEIPRLEAQLTRDPDDAQAMVRLGAAYRANDQHEDARTVLQRVLETDPENSGAVLFLGLTYEDLQQYAEARQLYERYLAVGRSEAMKRDLQRRLALLRRMELQASLREAIRSEQEGSSGPPQPQTVAVFPFRLAGQDTTLQPLSRALAEMLVADLSQTNRLRVLERLQVQLLLDELRLAELGLVDTATAARSGRLLRAERVVQGTIEAEAEQIRLDAAVLRVIEPTGVAAPASGRVTVLSEEDALNRLLDLEKRLALRLYSTMGVELTAAEQERVNQRPTQNLQAILAYGRGLQAADAGDFNRALRHFEEAVNIDPAFTAAQQQAAAAADLASAVQLTSDDLAARGGGEARGTTDAVPAGDDLVPDPSGRDAASEVLGTEGFGRRTILEIIIRRPSGGR